MNPIIPVTAIALHPSCAPNTFAVPPVKVAGGVGLPLPKTLPLLALLPPPEAVLDTFDAFPKPPTGAQTSLASPSMAS